MIRNHRKLTTTEAAAPAPERPGCAFIAVFLLGIALGFLMGLNAVFVHLP